MYIPLCYFSGFGTEGINSTGFTASLCLLLALHHLSTQVPIRRPGTPAGVLIGPK